MKGLLQVLLIPGLVGVGAAMLAIAVPRSLRPQVATRVLCALTVLSALTATWVFAVVTFANAVQLHGIAERLSWCSNLATKHLDTPTLPGVVAFSLFSSAVFGSSRTFVCLRRSRAPREGERIVMLPTLTPTAYAVPGQVVVSRGMFNALDDGEWEALMAHEQAHLALHHHRYVGAAEIAAAAIAPLRPIARRVRLSSERWADEAAAKAVGDRSLVARAIAHAALATTEEPTGALALGDTGTIERVEALLNPGSPASWRAEVTLHIGTGVVIAGLAISAFQVHDWVVRGLGLCWL